jgi:anti-sigma B factor antagonist
MANERLQVASEGGVTVARFRDHKILDEANIQQLGRELNALAESGDHPRLLLNFEDVEFLSSAALGKLISLKKKASATQTELKLCSIRPEIFEVFKITSLHQVFDICEDQDEALRRFAG